MTKCKVFIHIPCITINLMYLLSYSLYRILFLCFSYHTNASCNATVDCSFYVFAWK